ncbi:MAG: response regulator transcription factor [Pseudomonadota bacterium]|nr:response regulator transcription factor [Pseudomonadota bacterium]
MIVDDHPVVVTGCRAIFAGRAEVETFAVADGAGGIAAFFDWAADLALIDINLPDLSGFEVIRAILARAAEARLIAFSMNAEPAIAARAIEVGARAYLTKSDPPERFLDAVDALSAGDTYLTPAMAREIAFLHDRSAGALSARENDILRLLGAGSGLADVAAELGVSYKTIATNCAALKIKLGARTTGDLVRAAVEKRKL